MPMVIFTGNVTANAMGKNKPGLALGTVIFIAAGTAMYDALAANTSNIKRLIISAVTNWLKNANTHPFTNGIIMANIKGNTTNETRDFTEIDQSVSLGFSADGSKWKRNDDVLGIVFVANGISTEHQNYLKAGGKGFMIGDGNLNYAPEMILELFYNALLHEDHFWLSPDYQLVMNPSYNQDRGPAHVFAIRLHAEFGFPINRNEK